MKRNYRNFAIIVESRSILIRKIAHIIDRITSKKTLCDCWVDIIPPVFKYIMGSILQIDGEINQDEVIKSDLILMVSNISENLDFNQA